MVKRILLIIAVCIVVGVSAFLIWVASYPELSKVKTPSGLERSQSQYLVMRDGVKIAIEYWLPANYKTNEKLPTLIVATRYSRGFSLAQQLDFKSKMIIRLGQVDEKLLSDVGLEPEISWANEAGYIVVLVDARGSGASFGNRPIEWSPDEVADYGEVIAWIADQPWSNGKVGAWGTSYPGNTAELMASTGQPAFQATAPRFDDFDPLLGVGIPGGLQATGFLNDWSEFNSMLDHDVHLSRSVDEDKSGKLLEQAISEHNNPNIAESMKKIEYRDDEFGQSGLTYADASPYSLQDSINQNAVPMQVWVSWLDAATMDGALSRYLTFSNPQQVIIGPWNHGGSASIDPFNFEHIEVVDVATKLVDREIVKPQMAQVLDFFDCYLKDESCPETESQITYYTLNSGEWQTTSIWPPKGFETKRLYFAEHGVLSKDAPEDESVADKYEVDFTTTTGLANRWHAQMGTTIDYRADRAEEDTKLLTYTSEPLTVDTEIAGSPLIQLYLTSTTEDCAFHIYLEDVAPDGKVTYITEGILRAIHHKVSEQTAPYVHLGPYHSFNKADAAPLVPGEVTEISLNLYATSVLIEAGHSIRIAIAGADVDTFDRYPAQGSPVWAVQRNSVYPSSIELPVKEK
ncbi:MAG: CocE/NonD family hydrolase [Anaerolineaceae bacterium]|nr:CocE/NonD family hydrolase [Anaerolineaceae bacterium]